MQDSNEGHCAARPLAETAGSAEEVGGAGGDGAQAQHLNQVVAGLTQASKKIGGVVKLISQIAAQTNLLALNATIEAARAGEAGKGFAVVASEVKNLSRQTAGATEGITREVQQMTATAERTATLVSGMNEQIQALSEVSAQLSLHAEELGSSVETFLNTIRS